MESKVKSGIFKDFNGIILINKAPGLSSYDVLRNLKKVFFLIK